MLLLQVICRKTKENTLSGYTTIISALARESKTNNFAKSDLLTQCLIVQWFDYTVLFIDPAVNSKASTELLLQVGYCWIETDFIVPLKIILHAGNWDEHDSNNIVLSFLQELNGYLSTRSYLVGQSLTLADVVVYYSLCDIMRSLTPVAKEKYLNVSRWFEHLQNIGEIRQSMPLINLSTIYLHGWATGTHI